MVWHHKAILHIQCHTWCSFKAQNGVVVLWQNLDLQPGPDSHRCDVIMRKLNWCGANLQKMSQFKVSEMVKWWNGEVVKCWGGLSHNNWGSWFLFFFYYFSCVAVIITFFVNFTASFLQLSVQHDDLNRFCVCVLHLWLLSILMQNKHFCTSRIWTLTVSPIP